MISLYESEALSDLDSTEPFSTLPTRTKVAESLIANRNFDLIILGGGLTGAALAHRATLSGVSVLLLESRYFGYGSLSWDNRLISHLRRNPFRLLAARSPLRQIKRTQFSHLTSPLPFDSHLLRGFGVNLAKRFVPLFNLDERLLIRELVLAARQEGASVLAAIELKFLEAESAKSGCYSLSFDDKLSGTSYTVRGGGIVVDPCFGELPLSRLGSSVAAVASQLPKDLGGVEIFFRVKAAAGGGLSYLSFELSDGSFISIKRTALDKVCATVLYRGERLAAEAERSIVNDALSEGGWEVVERLGEREVFNRWGESYSLKQDKGVFSCSHTAPWDAFRSVKTILDAVLALAPRGEGISEGVGLRSRFSKRDLPGVELNCEVERFRALARAQGLSEETIEGVVARWRGRVRYIANFANGLRELTPGVLRGEIDLSVLSDQVVSFEDLICGSLGSAVDALGKEGEAKLRERFSVFQ